MSKKPVEKKPDTGIIFPLDKVKNDRSTSTAGKNIIAAAIRGSKAPNCEELAQKCEREKNWRFNYNKHFMNLVKVSAYSNEAALGASNAGIAYMHQNFDYANPSNPSEIVPFSEYMKRPFSGFKTGVISGTDKSAKPNLVVPYKGKTLQGESLINQMNRWAKYGTVEKDAADSVNTLATKPLDLTDHVYVLVGAGSAMGPFLKLLEHGATVVAIDIPGKWGEGPQKMWNRLLTTAKNSRGKIIFPMSADGNTEDINSILPLCGCNLTEQPGDILAWLKTVEPDKRLVIGNYTYLDSDMHVKLSLAADAVIDGLCKARKDTAVAFLCTPTDIHVIPKEANQAAKKNFGFHPGKLIETFINLLTLGSKLKKNALSPLETNDPNNKIYIVDGLSVAQGPNYALAKRLQHWRAMVAYNGNHTVSSNIAPSTATLSVISNKSFGWAYGGMPYFKPFEIFQQETTNAVMAALLVSDTTNKDSSANPSNRSKFGINNVMELFKFNSVHGGVWRAGYKLDTIGEVSAIIYFLGGPKMFLPICYIIFALIAGLIYKFTH